MPFNTDYEYEIQYTVEFEAILQWTGDGQLTFGGKTYNTGKILDVGDMEITEEITDSSLVIVMDAMDEAARDYLQSGLRP